MSNRDLVQNGLSQEVKDMLQCGFCYCFVSEEKQPLECSSCHNQLFCFECLRGWVQPG